MKKIIIIIGIILSCMIPVHADAGPKPSVIVNIQGLKNQRYYVTLLSEEDSTGPFCTYDIESFYEESEETEEYMVWQKMIDYQDRDGYYFLQYFQDCSETHQFQWVYHPPMNFKILIYLVEEDEFIVSQDIYNQYAFDSYFTVKVSQNQLTVSQNYEHYIFEFCKRAGLTIIIEILFAYYYQIRQKKQLAVIFGANLMTQIILNFILAMIKPYVLLIYIPYMMIEIGIIIGEYRIYKKHLPRYGEVKKNLIEYTILAHILSFIAGMIILPV